MDETDARRSLDVLVAGSTAALAEPLVESLRARGHRVVVVQDGFEESVTASHTIHLAATSSEDAALRTAAEGADAVLLLTGLGPLTSTVDDAHLLDVVLGSARPGAVLVETSPLGVFGDLAGAEADEDAVPDPPSGLEAARTAEVRVLAAEDWLRPVVVRTGIVYADGGGPLLEAAAALATVDGASRYLGRADAAYPLVHADALLALLVRVVEDAGVSGVLHAVTGWSTAHDLASAIAGMAGVDAVEPWAEDDVPAELTTQGPVPQVDVRATGARADALLQGAAWPTLEQALAH